MLGHRALPPATHRHQTVKPSGAAISFHVVMEHALHVRHASSQMEMADLSSPAFVESVRRIPPQQLPPLPLLLHPLRRQLYLLASIAGDLRDIAQAHVLRRLSVNVRECLLRCQEILRRDYV